jgi:hypothetical protein
MKLQFDRTEVGGFVFELLRGLTQADTGGAQIGECLAAARSIRDGDFASWTAAFAALAQHVSAQARASRRAGHLVTARGQYLRASNYYRMAAFYAAPGHPGHKELFSSSRASFAEAIACGLPAETIGVPFEGHRLPGYFVRGSGRRSPAPTLIAHGGFDSTAEELYHWIGVHAADRGWNCLIFEGPGQWGPVFDQPPLLMRPDWESRSAQLPTTPQTAPKPTASAWPSSATPSAATSPREPQRCSRGSAPALPARSRSTSVPPSGQPGPGWCAPCPPRHSTP